MHHDDHMAKFMTIKTHISTPTVSVRKYMLDKFHHFAVTAYILPVNVTCGGSVKSSCDRDGVPQSLGCSIEPRTCHLIFLLYAEAWRDLGQRIGYVYAIC